MTKVGHIDRLLTAEEKQSIVAELSGFLFSSDIRVGSVTIENHLIGTVNPIDANQNPTDIIVTASTIGEGIKTV